MGTKELAKRIRDLQKQLYLLKCELINLQRRKTATIEPLQISGLMMRLKQGFVTFRKKDGSLRVMKYEIDGHATADIDFSDRYLTVWDREKGGYRKVNLRTVSLIESDDGKLFYRVRMPFRTS